MTVYVDDMHLDALGRYGRMRMCHMIADTDEELHAMADRIEVARRWFQKPGQWNRHYDIATSKRAIAVAAGAVEISMRQSACMCACRRYGDVLGDPATARERRDALLATARARRANGELQ